MARHERMSVVRIAFAPSAASWSITLFALFRRTIDRTATQLSSSSGEIVGACRPGVIFTAASLTVLGQSYSIIRYCRASTTPRSRSVNTRFIAADLGGLLAVRAGLALDQRGLALGDRLADHHEAVLAQRAAGRHHVRDGVGQAQVHRDLHRAVELDDLGADPRAGQVRAHQARVRGGDPLALEVFDGLDLPLVQRRVPELGGAEAQLQQALHLAARLLLEVGAGHPEVQVTRADVGRDVLGPQVEELDVVLVVGDAQVARVRALPVPGLAHHRRGGFGEGPLVGECDAEHRVSPCECWWAQCGRADRAGVRIRGTCRRRRGAGRARS